jgi:hypothetical protein
MNITSTQYIEDINGNNSTIKAIIDGEEWYIPITVGNRHYDEIMRQVEAGTLTIQDAD